MSEGDKTKASKEESAEQKQSGSCVLILTMVAHFICALFTAFIIYTAQPGSSLFSWHPTLMALAFALLMAQGILVFSPQSSFFLKAARPQKVKVHWIIMVTALACAAVGGFIIWYNKMIYDKPHMVSWHGLVGYITLAYVATQCIAGSFQLFPKMAMKYVKLSELKKMHATSGVFLFLLATASLILGMNSSWFTSQVTGTSWYACLVCPVILLTVVTNQVTAAYLGKKQ